MKKVLFLIILTAAAIKGFSQASLPNAHYQLTASADWIQQKNYYLLTLFQQNKAVAAVLAGDEFLSNLRKKKQGFFHQSLTDCKDLSCFIDPLKFNEQEINQVSSELLLLCKPGSVLEKMVQNTLIPSMTYSQNKGLSPAEFLVKAWEQDAAGLNYTISVYAGGQKPNYPQADSIDFNVKSTSYLTFLYDVNTTLSAESESKGLFFEPTLDAALLYLQVNERQDPANYEPMDRGVNKAAIEHMKKVNWKKFPYTVILIPGAGPEKAITPLSPEGMLRCRLAAQEYRAGKAPFLMPSGGKVHPYKTTYCEAEQMKIYLLNVLHVPEAAIIMEPHARHTTTNLRNAVRLIYRYAMPSDKPALIVTDKSQTDGILNMAARCEKELRFVPYRLGRHVSETEVEFYPILEAFQINPYEPLDP